MPEPCELSASEAANAIRAGRLTSEQLVRSCLDRIARRDGAVRAWAALDPEAALQSARKLDGEPARSLLHGIPVGIKDIIDTKDHPTTYQSAIYHGHRPRRDAEVASRAERAGLVVLGKTTTQEFATRGDLPPTRNPHDAAHTPGGSSGGSAAAVADRQIPLAISTQTAGSIVRPASYCGVIGFKPSFGRIDMEGVKSLVPSCDTLGVHVRSVEDAALALAVLSPWDELAVFEAGLARPLRIAVLRQPFWEQAQPAARQAVETACVRLEQAGIAIQEARLPASFLALSAAHDIVSDYEARQALEEEWRRHRTGLSVAVQAKLERGGRIAHETYDRALGGIARCREAATELYADCDCLLTPSAPGLAPRHAEQDTGSSAFNKYWTTLGNPSINVPVPDCAPLPVGVQLVGPAAGDTLLLLAARRVQEILTTPSRHAIRAPSPTSIRRQQ